MSETKPLTEIEKITLTAKVKDGMTREEWLRHAVEELDVQLFEGDLDTLNHGYQIGTGRCGSNGQKMTECVQPFDGEDVKLEDFFPTTITVSYTIKDPIELLGSLALECIHAFFNEPKASTKRFKALASKYYFDKPFTAYHPTNYLKDILVEIYKSLVKQWGAYPGKPVVFHKREGEKKKNTYVYNCPNCGWECKATKKMYDKYVGKNPVCPCGATMTLVEDEINDEMDES